MSTGPDVDAGNGEGPVSGGRRAGAERALTATTVPPQAALVAGVLAVAALVVVAGGGVAGGAALGGVAVGALLAGTVATVAVDRPVRALVAGPGLLVAVGAAVSGPIVAGVLVGPHVGWVAAGGVLVGVGVARFRLAAFGAGAVESALEWLARLVVVVTLATVLVGAVTLEVDRVVAVAGGVVPIEPLVAPTSAGGAIVGFVAACWLAYGGVWLGAVATPVESVLSPARAARVDTALLRGVTVVGGVLGVGSVLVAAAYAVSVSAGVGAPVAPVLAGVVDSPALRIALLRLAAAGAAVAAAVTLVKAAGARTVGTRPTWLPSTLLVTAVALGGVLVVGDEVGATLAAADPTGWAVSGAVSVVGATVVGLSLVVVGLIATGAVLLLWPVTAAAGVLPPRSAAPRLLLFGLVLAAASAAVADGGVVRPLLGVTAGVAAWDIADHGIGVTADVGRTPARRDGTVVHAGASLLVGVGGVVGAGLAYAALTNAVPGSLLTAVVSAIAVVVLAVLLSR